MGCSYHGAQIFEIYGLGQEVVDTAFRGSVSRIGGLTLDEVRNMVQLWFEDSNVRIDFQQSS